jgi:hypothetical protein
MSNMFPTPVEIPDKIQNPLVLRDYLLKAIKANRQTLLYRPDLVTSVTWPKGYNGIINIPDHSDVRYSYARTSELLNKFIEKLTIINRYDIPLPEGVTMFTALTWFDRLDQHGHPGHRVNLEVALVAWLSSDEFRWHSLYPFCPEDLSYGLVRQYYSPVIDTALFFIGLPWQDIDIKSFFLSEDLPTDLEELQSFYQVLTVSKNKCNKFLEAMGTEEVNLCEEAARLALRRLSA